MCHVLIIEDDALLALDLEMVLRHNGATSVSFAVTEEEAVERAHSNRPQVITADVRLRDGTGPSAVARIGLDLGPIPAIFVTGTPEECRPCDPPHYVMEKPLDDDVFARVFRRMAFSA
jgi:two-component system, response regulator PdtaR